MAPILRARPYTGTERKLIMAFDVGTTYSGASYCILDPGRIPEIAGVNRYPGLERVGGDSKVPSIIYYTPSGKIAAIGAEAAHMRFEAEENEWTKAEWFKLHLRPKDMKLARIEDSQIPPLPPGKTVINVLADFLKYLYECSIKYIQETDDIGEALLRSAATSLSTEFVLSHPNGWGWVQQERMRRASVIAGLIPDSDLGRARLHFVTEGEASLHYCVREAAGIDDLEIGSSMTVIDAGGGTIDLSSFTVASTSPFVVDEAAPAGCILQGSVFVNSRAKSFIEDRLRGSKYDDPEIIQRIIDCFEDRSKRRFSASRRATTMKIQFGTRIDDVPELSIRKGAFEVPNDEAAAFFDPSMEAIVSSMDEQRKASAGELSIVWLVGGFAANEYLYEKLSEKFKTDTVAFLRPDKHVNKAVATGAISFYLNDLVLSRIARFTYGSKCWRSFNPNDPDHMARSKKLTFDASGSVSLPDAFSPILIKGTKVSKDQEFRTSFRLERFNLSSFSTISSDITKYRGSELDPRWVDNEPDMFSTLCTVQADTSALPKTLKAKDGVMGMKYYEQDVSIILSVGATEFKAQIAWMENGKEKRGPATVIFDEGEEGLLNGV